MKILNRSQIRSAEENAVNSGIFSFAQLMKKAGNAAADAISKRYDVISKKITVVCGKGNNGGDGIVIASSLKLKGADVSLYFPFGKPESEPAKDFLCLIENISVLNSLPNQCDMLIDAVFGIGLNRFLQGDAAELIEEMNMLEAEKIAVDIPSGVDCDAQLLPKKAFFADFTVTFIAPKPCFYMPFTSSFCGDVEVCDIGVKAVTYCYQTIDKPRFNKRDKNSHKGDFGTALLLCGSYGMCGAQILSAKAALRSGAGLVKSFVADKNYSSFCSAVPEAVTLPVPTLQDGSMEIGDEALYSALASSDAALIGCGLSTSPKAKSLVKRALAEIKIPVVLDADGINAVCDDINIIGKIKAPVIITPHPKEMARLCHTEVKNIECDRVNYAVNFARNESCVVVLKGANTVVASPDGRVFINTTGNSGLATGGSGDVLSGITVSLLAQGITPLYSALIAVYIHGFAADKAAEKISQTALLPTDVIKELKYVWE